MGNPGILLIALFSLLLAACTPQQEIAPGVPQGGDFRTPSTQGTFSTKDQRGKVIFLFFGFLRCPMVCPKTLQNLRTMIGKLPEADRQRIQVLFITVDPENDTLEKLSAKLGQYGPQFIGGRPDNEELLEIMKKYGAAFQRFPGDVQGKDSFNHTSSIFVINQKGILVDKVEFHTDPAQLRSVFYSAERRSPLYAKHRSSRTIQTVAGNPDCDLNQGECQVGDFAVSVGPRPITPEKKFSVFVRALKPQAELIPRELDVEGIELNMGYIHSTLSKVSASEYTGTFDLPACEQKSMRWKLKLLLSNGQTEVVAYDYFFNTHSN